MEKQNMKMINKIENKIEKSIQLQILVNYFLQSS